MLRFGIIILYLALSVVLSLGHGFASQSSPSEDSQGPAKYASPVRRAPKAVFPNKNHSFGEVFEGTEVKYSFVIKNKGDAPLVIKNIRPG